MDRIPGETLDMIFKFVLENERKELDPEKATDLRLVNKRWNDKIVDLFTSRRTSLLKLDITDPSAYLIEDLHLTRNNIASLEALIRSWNSPQQVPPFLLCLSMELTHNPQVRRLIIMGAASLVKLNLELSDYHLDRPISLPPLPTCFPKLVKISAQIVASTAEQFAVFQHYTQQILDSSPMLTKLKIFETYIYPAANVPPQPFTYPISLTHLETLQPFLPLVDSPPLLAPLTVLKVGTRCTTDAQVQDFRQRLLKLMQDVRNTLQEVVVRHGEDDDDLSMEFYMTQLPVMPNLRRISTMYKMPLTGGGRRAQPPLNAAARCLPVLEEVTVNQGNGLKALSGWVHALNSTFPTVRRLVWDFSHCYEDNIGFGTKPKLSLDLIQAASTVFPALNHLSITIPLRHKRLFGQIFQCLPNLESLHIDIYRDHEEMAGKVTRDWRQWKAVLLGISTVGNLMRLGEDRDRWNEFLETAQREQENGNWLNYPASIRNLRNLAYFCLSSNALDAWSEDEEMLPYHLSATLFEFGFGRIDTLQEIKIKGFYTVEDRAVNEWRAMGREIVIERETL